jgi:hypothetical protein
MADLVEKHAHVIPNQATDSFKPVARLLSAVLQRIARRRESGIEMMENVYAYKENYHVKEDPWLLLDMIQRVIW